MQSCWLGSTHANAYKQMLKFGPISGCPMSRTTLSSSTPFGRLTDRRVAAPFFIVALQSVSAIYFVFDGVNDFLDQSGHGFSLELMMECVAAIALLGGVVLGIRFLVRTAKELAHKERTLAKARGALAEHISLRFEEWRLTPGEGEVALFALKGYDVSEIARLRGAASGTVRSQLSQIYTKAHVTSQAMLVSLFIEDLLDKDPLGL
jgi:DNA-binding CsgD family transcriptional regulator